MIGRARLKPAAVEAGESQSQQDCQGAVTVPDGVWCKTRTSFKTPLPPGVWSYGEVL